MTSPATPLSGHVDVLIVGAGISGIGMGHHLATKQPGRSFAIVEARDGIGGTWHLFRYPGIRSDSDLHTFGYEFKPWTSDNSIADAHEIRDYLHDTVTDGGFADRIHFGMKVVRAEWSSASNRWTVTVQESSDGTERQITCRVLFSAAGYYDYDTAHTPDFFGQRDFRGQIVHPQFWPEDLDYTGKRVVVIGSGATAVTIVPVIAERAHVTMLQRSPTYVVPIPRKDPIANTLRRVLPDTLAYATTRQMNILTRWRLIYAASQRYPGLVRRIIRQINTWSLPDGYAVDPHFTPRYNPWDQRLCMAPDGDLFKAISAGNATVVTDTVDRFTEAGVLLGSGRELPADIIVTATGLNLQMFGGIALQVDGQPVHTNDTLVYKSFMLSGVPNFGFALGYTNISWTLKVDLVCEHLCRLLDHMDRHGHVAVTPIADDPTVTRDPMLDFAAGYVQRSLDVFPKRGSHGPWTVDQDYAADRTRLRHGPVEDPALHFTPAADRAGSDLSVHAG